jgi:hypothetical protein
MQELSHLVQRASSSSDRQAILDALESEGGYSVRSYGDRENNAGPIEVASSPYSAIIERVTNAIDGMLEMKASQQEGSPTPTDPQTAAHEWFGVPMEGLSGLLDNERFELAENIRVRFEESGVNESPTISVVDRGIGQHPNDFSSSILSLNASNKRGKPFLSGAYGQGGAATLRFADFTIILSRRAPDLLQGDQEDSVGWTLIWKDDGDIYTDKTHSYKYLTDAAGEIPRFPANELIDPSWYGMHVRHVGYEFRKYSKAITQPDGAFLLFNSFLFDPVLPFLLEGTRAIDKKSTGQDLSRRAVAGNRSRLERREGSADTGQMKVSYSNSSRIEIEAGSSKDPAGSISARYWVLQRPPDSDSKTPPTASFVGSDAALTVTLAGQRQDARRSQTIKTKARLPYLTRNLIVQIKVDSLSAAAKRELFSSTRERTVQGPLADQIFDEVVSCLRDDEELRRLNREERQRSRGNVAKKVNEKVRARIGKYIKTFMDKQTRKGGKGKPITDPGPPPPKPPGPPGPPRDTTDDHLPNAPTAISFEKPVLTIRRGRRSAIWVHIDAKNGYLPTHDDDLEIELSGLDGKVQVKTRSELLGGMSRWTLQALEDAPLGCGTLQVILTSPGGILQASAEIKVIKADPAKNPEGPEEPETGPNIDWVTRKEWELQDPPFDHETVGSVNISNDATDIKVNRDFISFQREIDERKNLSEGEVESRANRYIAAVAFGLFKQEYFLDQFEDEHPSEEYQEKEKQRLAESVLLTIEEPEDPDS